MGLSIRNLLRREPPVASWAQDAGRALGRAFAAQGYSTTLHARHIGPTFILFEFTPRPPTPTLYAALAKQSPTVRRLLQVEHCVIQERSGRVVVRVPNPQPFALDHRGVEGDGLDVPLGLADTGAWDGVDFARSPHLGVFGASGEGKTTLVRAALYHLTRQNDANELRLFVVARDLGDWRNVAATPHAWGIVRHADALTSLKWLAAEAERREMQGITLPRIFAIVDDCVTLIQRAPQVGALLDGLSSQARHAGVHLIIISQAATREGTGSAILLKNLTRRYVFGSAGATESAFATGRAGTGAQYLVKGEAVSVDGRVTRIVTVPNVTADTPMEPRPGWAESAPWDADRLACPPLAQEPLPAVSTSTSTSTSATPEPPGWVEALTGERTSTSTSTSYDPDEAQRMRIRALDAQGLSRNSIAAIVFGHKNKAVMDYIRAALEETA